MRILISFTIIFQLICLLSCNSQSASQDTRSTPTQTDSAYAYVFKPWDGHWKGTFTIYIDSTGQAPGNAQPRIKSRDALDNLPLEVNQTIEVEQFYESTSPFYQTVRILDTYESDGKTQTVESKGYNAVEKGQLVCVVNKPDEQVVHQGTSLPDSTLIWERSLSNPTKVEYFYEQVSNDTYYIVGWGYYGDDDPGKSPKMWFYGEYQKQ